MLLGAICHLPPADVEIKPKHKVSSTEVESTPSKPPEEAEDDIQHSDASSSDELDDSDLDRVVHEGSRIFFAPPASQDD